MASPSLPLARDWLGEGENSPYEHLREMQPAAGKTRPIKIVGILCIQGCADAKTKKWPPPTPPT